MAKFRKKPVVIDAWKFDGTWESIKELVCEHESLAWSANGESGVVYIDTLEGRMIASAGDWIIKGVKGEFYPCKPDIFAATYEAADD